MSVLVAAAATSAEVTVAAGTPVSIVLVPTTAAGLPKNARAIVSWKGASGINSQFLVIDGKTPGASLVGAGTYVVDKKPNTTYTVERN